MDLAKPALDVGLYTNQLEPMLAFWQNEAHARFTELLPVGGGVHQHRHALGDSVLKINHPREPIAKGEPTGLVELTIFGHALETLTDPDNNRINLVPADDKKNIKLTLTTPRLSQMQDYYGDTLGLTSRDSNTFAAGASEIQLIEGELGRFDRSGIGYRYMTFSGIRRGAGA